MGTLREALSILAAGDGKVANHTGRTYSAMVCLDSQPSYQVMVREMQHRHDAYAAFLTADEVVEFIKSLPIDVRRGCDVV
jgi:hypothetical protein